MLIFRGLALVVMGSKGLGPYPDPFKALFNSYIPGLDKDPDFIRNISVVIAVVICAALIAAEIISRTHKKRKGYQMDNPTVAIAKLLAVGGVVLFVSWRLGHHRGIPVLLVLLGAIVLFYTYFTQNTAPGRYLYAMGGNEKAARLSGVNTKKMMFFAYTNMGFLSGVAALVCVARFNQAGTQAGQGYELDAIGACFIGGASAYGGVGKVSGAVIGAIFMGVLNMGMSILGADQNLQRVIKGLVLLAAVIFDVLSKNRKQTA
jgi:putative multiple sugar transport system permease protein